MFPRLYSLSNQKESKAVDLLESHEGIKEWVFVWRRNLFQWEQELVVLLRNLLESVVLSPEDDCWCWLPDPDKGFSVNSSYKLLSKELLTEGVVDVDLERVLDSIWSSSAPSKVIASLGNYYMTVFRLEVILRLGGLLVRNYLGSVWGVLGKKKRLVTYFCIALVS
jgi:hypothetical protein